MVQTLLTSTAPHPQVCTAAAVTSMVSGVAVGILALGERLPGSPAARLARFASWVLILAGIAGLAAGSGDVRGCCLAQIQPCKRQAGHNSVDVVRPRSDDNLKIEAWWCRWPTATARAGCNKDAGLDVGLHPFTGSIRTAHGSTQLRRVAAAAGHRRRRHRQHRHAAAVSCKGQSSQSGQRRPQRAEQYHRVIGLAEGQSV